MNEGMVRAGSEPTATTLGGQCPLPATEWHRWLRSTWAIAAYTLSFYPLESDGKTPRSPFRHLLLTNLPITCFGDCFRSSPEAIEGKQHLVSFVIAFCYSYKEL